MDNNSIQNICILGSTGSIGTQSLDVIRDNPSKFKATVLVACNNYKLMEAQVREFLPSHVVMTNPLAAKALREALGDIDTAVNVKIYDSAKDIEQVVAMDEVDTVITAMVGIAGLLPTISAIKARKKIALANKETLVCAGALIMPMARKYGADIIPVDSEHSAIFQALQGINDTYSTQNTGNNRHSNLNRIILTASGGPFRGKSHDELKQVTVESALAHPNWSMGAKITIDSASLANKGLEVIEATHLFGVPSEMVDVLVHPQSIVHSMIECVDGAVIAQLGIASMKLPIAYALTYPNRIELDNHKLDFFKRNTLTFEPVDTQTFPLLELAYHVSREKGILACVYNGADEVAVDLFLRGRISFLDIFSLIEKAVLTAKNMPISNINDVFTADAWARERVLELI